MRCSKWMILINFLHFLTPQIANAEPISSIQMYFTFDGWKGQSNQRHSFFGNSNERLTFTSNATKYISNWNSCDKMNHISFVLAYMYFWMIDIFAHVRFSLAPSLMVWLYPFDKPNIPFRIHWFWFRKEKKSAQHVTEYMQIRFGLFIFNKMWHT